MHTLLNINIPLLHIKLLTPTAKLPTYATEGSVGLDIYSDEAITLQPHSRTVVSTGISIELPNNTEAQVRSRSGLMFNYGISSFHGTIDSDYRGEIKGLLINDSDIPYHITLGDRIFQLVINEVIKPTVIKVNELSTTTRNTNGFGSTGYN